MKTSSPAPCSRLNCTVDSPVPLLTPLVTLSPFSEWHKGQREWRQGYPQYMAFSLCCSFLLLCHFSLFLNTQRCNQLWSVLHPLWSQLEMGVYSTGQPLTSSQIPTASKTLPHKLNTSTLSVMLHVRKDTSKKKTKGKTLSVLSTSMQRIIPACRA